MKTYISAEDWKAIKAVLMRAQVPFHTSFDAHVNDTMDGVTYDEYIRVEPFVIQTVEEVEK